MWRLRVAMGIILHHSDFLFTIVIKLRVSGYGWICYPFCSEDALTLLPRLSLEEERHAHQPLPCVPGVQNTMIHLPSPNLC